MGKGREWGGRNTGRNAMGKGVDNSGIKCQGGRGTGTRGEGDIVRGGAEGLNARGDAWGGGREKAGGKD